MKMTRFEKDSLITLLSMYENELNENGATLDGEPIPLEKLEEVKSKLRFIETFLVWMDK